MSKIQSESNSQHRTQKLNHMESCDRYVKDTIWKQFTTPGPILGEQLELWSVCQRYNLKAIHNTLQICARKIWVVIGMSKIQSESNSQPTAPTVKGAISLWSVCQRYNLKAIHNYSCPTPNSSGVVIGMSKIQSESNSQRSGIYCISRKSCDRYVKDTIWKQFTTVFMINSFKTKLWSVCQRYNLKAIHN